MKTFVAVRPGFQSQAIAAFGAEMELVVDDTLQHDYEFRTREEGLADFLEAQLEDEEGEAAKKADPKNAHTFIVPLLAGDDTLTEPEHLTFLVIRLDRKDDQHAARDDISSVKIVKDDDIINVKATVTLFHRFLKDQGYKVHSISVVRGLTTLEW